MNEFLTVCVDGVVYSSWLFITAVGLTLVYGVMKIVNLTHGTFYALGAYVAADLCGRWLAGGYPPLLSYAVLLLSALLAGVVVGPLVERLVLSRMYARDEVVIMLATYALFLIFEDVIKLVWGVQGYSITEPYTLLGTVDLGELPYPVYDLMSLPLAGGIAALLTWAQHYTRQGKLLIAVIHDREVSAAMGIDVGRVYLVTFVIGCVLAAIGGAFNAPTRSVVPGLGVDVIVLSFAVVVIGGMGSLPGAVVGSVIVGLVRAVSVHYWPEVELFTIYLVMALVLAFRPRGLFMTAEARKI